MHGAGKVFVLGAAALALLGAVAAWGQDADVAEAAEVAVAVAEVPAADPLESAIALGVQEALAVLPGHVRDAMSPDDAKQAVLEGVLRAGDPGVVFLAGEDGAPTDEWDAGLLLTGAKELPRVSFVAPESAAAAAEISVGERLAEVGGVAVEEGCDLAAVRAALRGGTEAGLTVKVVPADGGEAREVVLERRRRADVPGLAGAERLPTGIGYLRVAWMKDGVAEEVSKALAGWQEENRIPAGVVLDLRGAGGDADAEREIVGIATRFALPGKILYRVDEGTASAVTIAVGALPGDRVRKPLMVLVDEGTTGAAELLAIALGGGGEGVLVVGRETSGNPLVREVVELGEGRKALLAVHAVTDAAGRRYDGRAGLVPSLEIGDRALAENVYEPEEPVLRKGKSLSEEEKEDRALRDRTRFDPYLRRAADVLLGLQAIGHEWR